jgi:hypothetical protein
MNRIDAMGMPNQSRAYSAAQSGLNPVPETLQVEDSLEALREVVEFHSETVLALIRRIEPLTGEVMVAGLAGVSPSIPKVQLAFRIDTQIDRISNTTGAVQAAIRALQI